MNDFDKIKNLPDISFIDNLTLEDIKNEMKQHAIDYLKNEEGIDTTLETASELNAEINACSVILYHGFNYVDRGAKQNLIKYSYGEFLDNLGATVGLTRNSASYAVCKVRFLMGEAKDNVIPIPKGLRISDGSGHIFKTDEYAEIAIGGLYVDVNATAIEAGAKNNNIPIGNINVMVEPIQYIDTVSNIDITAGGAEIESDLSFAERIHLAPSNNNKTGSEDGYIYNVKAYSSAIGDIKAISVNAGVVNIYILMNDGTLPSDTICQEIVDYLYGSRRAMTDQVIVSRPEEVNYDVNFTYYIESGQDVTEVQAKVNQAVADYIVWQRKISKDINPDKLTQLVLQAGAKRVSITAPTFTTIDDNEVSNVENVNVVYGGIEDD